LQFYSPAIKLALSRSSEAPMALHPFLLASLFVLNAIFSSDAHAQCDADMEWFEAEITYIHGVQWIPTVEAGEYVPVQRIEVDGAGWPAPVVALLCHPQSRRPSRRAREPWLGQGGVR
jgi:hypothetical protein